MGMIVDKNNYYSNLTPEFNPSCTIKSIQPLFVNKTLEPARKFKYDPQKDECEVLEDGNERLKKQLAKK